MGEGGEDEARRRDVFKTKANGTRKARLVIKGHLPAEAWHRLP